MMLDYDLFRRQQMGYLSSRKYPAQIAFSWSGEHFEGSHDFLEGEIFHAFLPDGQRMEVYIISESMKMALLNYLRIIAFLHGLGVHRHELVGRRSHQTTRGQGRSGGPHRADADRPSCLHGGAERGRSDD